MTGGSVDGTLKVGGEGAGEVKSVFTRSFRQFSTVFAREIVLYQCGGRGSHHVGDPSRR